MIERLHSFYMTFSKQMATTDQGHSNVSWTRKLEDYFSSTGERAHCLSWAHQRAEGLYAYRRTFIDLPVIVLSGVTGFMSVGSTTMFEGNEKLASVALGAVSLFVGLLNTAGAYFAWAKKSEAHRIAALQYSKLYRFIAVELALPREERTAPAEFLKYCKEQYDRLSEISPPLPEITVNEFKSRFKGGDLKDISVPEQMNGLEPIYVYSEEDLARDLALETNLRKLEGQFARLNREGPTSLTLSAAAAALPAPTAPSMAPAPVATAPTVRPSILVPHAPAISSKPTGFTATVSAPPPSPAMSPVVDGAVGAALDGVDAVSVAVRDE